MIVVSYISFCLVLAYINYRRISYDLPISHGLNALLHILFWAVAYFASHNWMLVITLPFIGRLFFDTGLNLMRGLPIDYVSRTPKSMVDKIEKSVFGNDGILPKIIYLTVSIALLVWMKFH